MALSAVSDHGYVFNHGVGTDGAAACCLMIILMDICTCCI